MNRFKSRENCAKFKDGCAKLQLPCGFGFSELEQGNMGLVSATLVHLAHAAALRNVGVDLMDTTLLVRVGAVAKERNEEVAR
jgi:hypothetical protein